MMTAGAVVFQSIGRCFYTVSMGVQVFLLHASWENKGMTFEEKKEAVETLLHEFCKANGGY